MRTSAYSLQIGTDSRDANALILLAEGVLIAVLVELSDKSHGEDRGKWAIEATFGIDDARAPGAFASAASAADWVGTNICKSPFILSDALAKLT